MDELELLVKAERIAKRIDRALADAKKLGLIVFVDGSSGSLVKRGDFAGWNTSPELVTNLLESFASGQH